LEQVQLDSSFRNKFIILLPCGLLEDNNTFKKMCIFNSLTGYIVCGGYVVKRDSAYTHTQLINIRSTAGQFSFMVIPTFRFIHENSRYNILS
jgi:hypothetical protein